MLPESHFPVTGGIMQTEEVVPHAQSTGVDGCLTDSPLLQHPLHHSPHIQSPLPPLVHMAVKQEPQEEEERDRDTSILGPQAESDAAPAASYGHVHAPHGHPPGHQPNQGLAVNAGQTVQDTGGRARPSRGRRKSRWKLKFHHQALPPEYLDHYEAALAQEALNSSPTPIVAEPTAPSPAPASTPSPVADVHGWLQRIAAMQQELCPATPPSPVLAAPPAGSRRSVITSTAHPHPTSHHHHHLQSQPAPRPPMKYSDLPYMGEITLDNSKPRRGRKPKKADICHLIYKNYGTILPGTPGHEERKPAAARVKLESRDAAAQLPFQRSDVQNRISSLLEKRLTQESRRSLALAAAEGLKVVAGEQEEPLNLCIRDLDQLKIRLLRKHGNVYESGRRVKSEEASCSDGEDVECLGPSSPDVVDHARALDPLNNNSIIRNNNSVGGGSPCEATLSPNPGFVYWPNAGVFIHPMALQSQFLYYQKMAAQSAEKRATPLPEPPPPPPPPKEQKIVPKSVYSMLESKSPVPSAAAAPSPLPRPMTAPAPESPRPKRNAPLCHPQGQPGIKRKRSAIFIPPMPTENNNNPATEVSICKFKFTGGAKPSLQEKKSLSVDSGGNFRYYSGTGDKSMRGYEFFPRESLQQPAGQAGSSAGAFLSAAGERIPPPVCQRVGPPGQEEGRRKRKTRKSLQREKLEQTFKEKGFLIQTQQLESAEGATYCKFRQLRKFTRYLFRSWKDYLPGNVRELTGGGASAEGDLAEAEAEGELPVVGSRVPPTSLLEVPSNLLDEPRSLSLT